MNRRPTEETRRLNETYEPDPDRFLSHRPGLFDGLGWLIRPVTIMIVIVAARFLLRYWRATGNS